jgi:hypothetical protein
MQFNTAKKGQGGNRKNSARTERIVINNRAWL